MSDEMKDFYRGGAEKAGTLWTLPFLSFVMLNVFVFMGFDLLLPTLSVYLELHGNSEAEIGRIFGTFTISAILMRMLASRLALLVNAQRLVRLGLLACALAGLWYYWAHSLPTGMAARFIHGAGFGLASTLITALASQIIPPARMGEGLGYLGLGTTLALALGPFFGIWLVDEFGYLVMFVVVAAFYASGIVVVACLPKIRLASAAPGAPKPRLVLLSRKVLAPSLLMFLMGVIMSAVTIFLALFCKEKNLPYAGHFFVLSTIGIFISRFSAGRIHDRFGHCYIILPAGLLILGCMLFLAEATSRDTIFLVSVVYGLATGAVFPSLQALTLSLVPLSGRTEAAASFFNAFDLGIGAGSLIFGHLASRCGTYASVYLGAAGVAALFLLFHLSYYVLLKPFRKKRGNRETT
ncbi:MAG: MFS transporter [Candidatus Adiutrix sp.]|jgi:predicted MFS family arabinose efflux permease|nr:MFS transporter [Candidatus Adiutrix sp.]